MNRLLVVGLVGAVLLTAAFVLMSRRGDDRIASPEEDAAAVGKPEEKPQVADVVVLRNSPFAMEYGKEGGNIERDLAVLQIAFQEYLSFVKGGYRRPIGNNADFVRALAGDNISRVAPIPPDHPLLGENAELLDRFGTPLFVHPLSEKAIELRSAGPDRKLWTEDDVRNVSPTGKDILAAMESGNAEPEPGNSSAPTE